MGNRALSRMRIFSDHGSDENFREKLKKHVFFGELGEKFSIFEKVSMSSDRSWHADYDKNIPTVPYSTKFSRKFKKTKSGVFSN